MAIAQKLILTSLLIIATSGVQAGEEAESFAPSAPPHADFVKEQKDSYIKHPLYCPCLQAYSNLSDETKIGDQHLRSGRVRVTPLRSSIKGEIEKCGISPSGNLIAALIRQNEANEYPNWAVCMWENGPNPKWTKLPKPCPKYIESFVVSDNKEQVAILGRNATYDHADMVFVTEAETKSSHNPLCFFYDTEGASFQNANIEASPKYAISGFNSVFTVQGNEVKELNALHSRSDSKEADFLTVTPYHILLVRGWSRSFAAYCLQEKKWLPCEESKIIHPPLSLQQMLAMANARVGPPKMPDTTTGEMVRLVGLPAINPKNKIRNRPEFTHDGRHMVYKPFSATASYPEGLRGERLQLWEYRKNPSKQKFVDTNENTVDVDVVDAPQWDANELPALLKVSKIEN